MQISITGSSGLVGSALIAFLEPGGHEVLRLVRGKAGAGEASWDPLSGEADTGAMAGCKAVIHLAGENVASGRWTEKKKARIRDSRIHGTRVLAEALAGMSPPPEVLVSASAIGFYGDRGDLQLDEQGAPGRGFLSEVCRRWEAATQPAIAAGIRVVHLRIGMVLSPRGGALAKMLLPFRLGLGGRVGHGRQFWSWISLDDLVGVIHHAVMNHSLRGPVNAVAPHPVTNREFTRTLGQVLSRPTVFPMPAFVASLALGEMANELLLASTRVLPKRLEQTGYAYQHARLESALRHLLVPSTARPA